MRTDANKIKKIRKWALFIVPITLLTLVILELTNTINLINKKTSSVETASDSGDFSPNNTIDYGPADKDDVIISPEKINAKESSNDTPNSDTPITVLITRANRNEVSVYIEKIEQGTCKLIVYQNEIEKISRSANVTSNKDYSTCEGFVIDSGKLDSSPFTVKIVVESAGRIGTATQEVAL